MWASSGATRSDSQPDQAASVVAPPAIALPKGGGAIRGIDEKFGANPVTGTGSLSVPIAVSPGRSGFGPTLALGYDSGGGNGPFGLGWTLGLPAVSRSTDKRLPTYHDAAEADVFVLAGAEELVPELDDTGVRVSLDAPAHAPGHRIDRYRPRTEGAFIRIERWTRHTDGDVHWRTIGRDNVTTVFGDDPAARIADPADPSRVFSWLISLSHDDRGNAIRYEYKADNGDGVDPTAPAETHRGATDRAANRYLKRIRYGNRVSRLLDPQLAAPDWAFEVVFDYGEHDHDIPTPHEVTPWLSRHDAFSGYRAGFEVRTYRLCQRVLMFHHFADEPDVGTDCLVRSTTLRYTGDPRRGQPVTTLLAAVIGSGHRRDGTGYLTRSLPALEFDHSPASFHHDVRELDADTLAGLPYGLSGPGAHWVDLDGDGLSGVLVEQGGSWLYHRNRGGGRLAPAQAVASQPSPRALAGGRQQLLDLAGDGTLDVVDLTTATGGFAERDGDGWGPFRAFPSLPTVDFADVNARLVDLDGDGLADLLVTETEALTWYPSLGEQGFGEARRRPHPLDDRIGPRLVFGDRTDSVHLADMSGDGLADLVRVRNGEVCYWPNLGHGRFGARVTMAAAPFLGEPGSFDQRRVLLADVDGSGVADLIHLGADGVRVWLNQSGNGFAAPHRIDHFPPVDDRAAVTVTDLLGTGTSCLVWSSPLPADAGHHVRYLDLMGGAKPHLLVGVRNNLGAETRVRYASSTTFCLADRAAGRPWVTRLPFPVQVVERVETLDRLGGNRFVTRYAYHHGHYDGVEREFRGFGLVEQIDTDHLSTLTTGPALAVAPADELPATSPPVLTRTWFHTGQFDPAGRISRHYEHEYATDDADDVLLDDTVLPAGLSVADTRQACRALRGSVLRQEIYALDGSAAQALPYLVTEHNATVRLVQPRAGNSYPVFLVHARETVTRHHERVRYPVDGQLVADPRTTHEVTLDVDAHGNVLRSVSLAYGRRHPDPALSPSDQAVQARLHATLVEHRYTAPVLTGLTHRAPLPAESRTFELLNLTAPAGPLGIDELRVAVAIASDGAHDIAHEDVDGATAPPGQPCRRLLDHTRTVYRRDDLTGPLPLGTAGALALPHESYRLAMTRGLVTQVYGDRVTDAMLTAAGYVRHDDHWWVPSGRGSYAAADTTPAAELETARRHFFLARRFRDPFGATATVGYDPHDLFAVEATDALGNHTTAQFDYRVLQARLVTDPNGNRTAVAFDALGLLVGTAVMGKPHEQLGDTLTGFPADLTDAAIAADLADPLADPAALLAGATTRLVPDLFAYHRTRHDPQPPVVHTLARETHGSDLAPGEHIRVQHTLAYSDGFGRTVQTKAPAEPGPLTEGGPTVPRWVGSGWTVFDDKGRPVRRYEPFFTATHRFESGRTAGVSPVLCHDPVRRVVATLHPDHTWQKVVFDPWRQRTWDVNDTVLLDPTTDPDLRGFATLLPADDYLPTWYAARVDGTLGEAERAAAVKAAAHAATPTVAYLDPLGRPFLTVTHNRDPRDQTEQHQASRVLLDIQGNQRQVTDAHGRVVVRHDHGPGGRLLRERTMDAGERRTLPDIAGRPCLTWDSRGHRHRTEYDALRRPTATLLRIGDTDGHETVIARTDYGEELPDATTRNLRTAAYRWFDDAGVLTTDRRDFKGNTLATRRRFTVDYRTTPDWSTTPQLEPDTHLTATHYDALNRPIQLVAPHLAEVADVVRPGYDDAGLLDRVDVWTRRPVPAGLLDPTGADLHAVTAIDHDARGQRSRVVHGNGTVTTHSHDPLTFRLRRLTTRRGTELLQDVRYTYDPAGNVTAVRDEAQQTVFFRNQLVEPHTSYTYDALYRLVEATGREQLGEPAGPTDQPRVGLQHPGDGNALGRYTERYHYDQVGNILELVHQSTQSATSWTRRHTYDEPSQLEPDRTGNRLSGTRVGDGPAQPHQHDAHGNLILMPHLPVMTWDHADRLRSVARQVVTTGIPETTHYVYDGAGQRVRKVTERAAAAGATPTRAAERRYLGGFELHREYAGDGTTVTLERQTLHVMDDQHRVALVETRTVGTDPGAATVVRFQHGNHLGSAVLELDAAAQIVSYEEYHPFGSTAYQAVRAQTETAKRYRYTGKERDAETGLYYHGARYYAPWLGRWTAADPAGLRDGLCRYAYVGNRPIVAHDPDGRISVLVVLAAVVITALTVVSAANAPTSQQEAAHAEPSISNAEYAGRVAVNVATGIAGGSVGTAATRAGASKVAAGAAEGASSGAAAAAANRAVSDVARGHTSTTGEYVADTVTGGAAGGLLGGSLSAARQFLGKAVNSVRRAISARPAAPAPEAAAPAPASSPSPAPEEPGHIGSSDPPTRGSTTNPNCHKDLCVADVGAHEANKHLAPGRRTITNEDFVKASGRPVDQVENPILSQGAMRSFLEAGFAGLHADGWITRGVRVEEFGSVKLEPGRYLATIPWIHGRHALHAEVGQVIGTKHLADGIPILESAIAEHVELGARVTSMPIRDIKFYDPANGGGSSPLLSSTSMWLRFRF